MNIQTLAMQTIHLRIFLEEHFTNHEIFREYDTESEEVGDSGNEEVNNSEWFSPKLAFCGGKQNLGRILGTKGPAKDVTSPVKSW
ncbi:hypothetical protein AVEN_106789-1 [Araneus ventricosus]|uniref:Uncharacterized protein n=1 Tax=Araneus ventricosus TaxID=182803 RepID=A0A4Y2P3H4_ARAVE|nr:hypothetical protein AVEN_106789-1 [Araneus ventricosus]